jgi:hypothetical protein
LNSDPLVAQPVASRYTNCTTPSVKYLILRPAPCIPQNKNLVMTLAMTNQLISTTQHNYPVETEIFRPFCLLYLLKSLSNKSKKPSEMIEMSENDFYDC